jgi:hypothetical protein
MRKSGYSFIQKLRNAVQEQISFGLPLVQSSLVHSVASILFFASEIIFHPRSWQNCTRLVKLGARYTLPVSLSLISTPVVSRTRRVARGSAKFSMSSKYSRRLGATTDWNCFAPFEPWPVSLCFGEWPLFNACLAIIARCKCDYHHCQFAHLMLLQNSQCICTNPSSRIVNW